jgi:membrane-associated phospholipid phosphatase
MRREDRLWELCLCFAGTLTLSVLISAAYPAVGAFVHYGTPAAVLDLLPEGSGIYHLPKFEAYRSGEVSTIDFAQLQGVLTFPSFHCAMALMTAYAFRGMRWLAGLGYGWNGLVIVSTIPIGGHYAVDLLVGALVWSVFAALARPQAEDVKPVAPSAAGTLGEAALPGRRA